MDIKILHMIEGAKEARGITVIIDVFRAFSVEAYFFSKGAEAIIPVGDVDLAYKLKEKNPEIKIVAVEPLLSPMLSRGKFSPHGLQGMGPDFVPPTFDASLCDAYIGVSDQEAMQMARALACEEGLLVGISSGAVVAAALKLAQEKDFENKRMVLLLPDTGERYLSTALFSQQDSNTITK